MFTQRKRPANASRLAWRLVLIVCLVGAQLTQAMGQRVRNQLANKGHSPHVNRVVNKEPYAYVDPLIGTARGKQGYGQVNSAQTFPAVGVPFGTTQWTPQTEDGEAKCLSPYYYTSDRIQGFRGSHWLSGSCTQDYGSVTLMPLVGDLKVTPASRASKFSHDKETATPAYYAVTLDDYRIKVELTGTMRAGFLRFIFPKSKNSYVVIHPNSRKGEGYVRIIPDRGEIEGYNPVHRIYQGLGKSAGFSGYFVARFDKPFASFGTWSGEQIRRGSVEQSGGESLPGAFVEFATGSGGMVQVKVGTSFISLEKARENLEGEIPGWDFARVSRQAKAAWHKALSKIEVKGGTEERTSIFYTALYHAQLLPRVFNELDGSYKGFDGDRRIHRARGFNYYDDFSLWDTYRAQHPLLTLIEPERTRDMIKSLVAKAEQGGWLPIFPCWNNYTSAMIGDHAIAMIADAYLKGIRDFDAQKAYSFMRKNATQQPATYEEYVDGKGRRALNVYLKYGYIPVEEEVKEAFHQREQVSRTLEYAYDDFVLAQMAKALGKNQDYEMFSKRAQNYRNVFDPDAGFVRGRHMDGSWVEPFDPTKVQPYITEGTPWQYTWYVPHDVPGLINLMGGSAAFVAKLDTLFERGYYWHGNEPSHQIAYLYNYAGAPWKTQERVRKIAREEYEPGAGGLKGNDDAGQMSAWYIFSALGFYPVTPGRPTYEIGSPVFDEALIHFGNRRSFRIKAENVSPENQYIQSATLNGVRYDKPWITHADIIRGGTLTFRMGSQPSKWGTAAGSKRP